MNCLGKFIGLHQNLQDHPLIPERISPEVRKYTQKCKSVFTQQMLKWVEESKPSHPALTQKEDKSLKFDMGNTNTSLKILSSL